MHRPSTFAFSLTCAGLVLFGASSSFAQTPPPKTAYSLRVDQVFSGSLDRTSIAHGSPYPLNKRFEHFTPEEKALLRSFYEDMHESDEPPFPLEGMKYIIPDVAKIALRLHAESSVSIVVGVNERGEATGVKLVDYPDMQTAKAIAYVLVKQKYKPGICAGTPCQLEFPFQFRLRP